MEKKGNMNVDDWETKKGTRVVSTTIPNTLWLEAKRNGLNWNDCLAFGIQFKLAERDVLEYPDNKLLKNLKKLQDLKKEKGK